jgi:hypothetical protein
MLLVPADLPGRS